MDCPENFWSSSPQEFVHVDVVVGGGRSERERRGGLRALLEDHLLEAGQVGRIRGADRAVFVAGDETLQLKSDQAGHPVGLVAGDEAAHRFRGSGAAAEIVVVLVEIIATGVGGVRFPVVRGPTIAAGAIEGEVRWSASDAGIKIDAVDVRRNGVSLGGIDGDGDVGIGGSGRSGACLAELALSPAEFTAETT